MILNYIGPENGQGIWIYYNGVKLDGGITKYGPSGKLVTPAEGTVVVGKFENKYASVVIDELLLFNAKLTTDETEELYKKGFPRIKPCRTIFEF